MSAYTRVPSDVFSKLQLNAGMLLTSFNIADGTYSESAIIGATGGGVQFNAAPTYSDFGEDIDNCPKGTMELMRLETWEVTMSGTLLSVDSDTLKRLIGVADQSEVSGVYKLTPRSELAMADFDTIWWVGEYSGGGFVAIKMFNSLSTGGFQLQTSDNGKGQFAFTLTGHFSIDAQDVVPFEVYLLPGAEETPHIELETHRLEMTEGDTYTFRPSVIPSNATISWSSTAAGKASVAAGVVTAESEGTAIITASITDSGVTYNDTCTVIVSASE